MDSIFLNPALVLQIFVLLNPLSSFPILMSAFKRKMHVRKIAVGAVITAYVVALIIAMFGPVLFKVFGVSLDAFRIAGGIVLLLLGLSTIRPQKNGDREVTGVESTISIIATPMLTGPATISFITIKTYELGFSHLFFNITYAFIIVGLLFILFGFAISKINTTLIDISSRILGLFLTAVAIEMMAKGISGIIASLV